MRAFNQVFGLWTGQLRVGLGDEEAQVSFCVAGLLDLGVLVDAVDAVLEVL